MKLVKFETDSCANCKVMGNILDAAGVSYESLNVMHNIALARKLNIRSVPVLMYMSGESEVSRYAGSSVDKEAILNYAGAN